jgi:hypothetical protein
MCSGASWKWSKYRKNGECTRFPFKENTKRTWQIGFTQTPKKDRTRFFQKKFPYKKWNLDDGAGKNCHRPETQEGAGHPE